ncbi:uncharacterized protein METZ01_LOCUS135857 [marine metagenome]|uniref:Uncharacterized protein n=1 Tax=marine metagenome TaxID=408172 RepID=A0A381Z2E5_9ZZZZ
MDHLSIIRVSFMQILLIIHIRQVNVRP